MNRLAFAPLAFFTFPAALLLCRLALRLLAIVLVAQPLRFDGKKKRDQNLSEMPVKVLFLGFVPFPADWNLKIIFKPKA